MYRFSLLFLSLLFLLSSCNKDDEQVPIDENSEADFYALKVGNKWTYNFFRVDGQSGELIDIDAVEEVEITEEQVVGTETLYTMTINTSDPNNACGVCNEETTLVKQVKDSLGYLVEVGGPILFSSENNADYLVRSEEWGTVYRVLLPNEVLITVPAGQFVSKVNQRYAVLSNGGESNGKDKLYYADGIGEIRQTYSTVINLNILYEKHLVSYSVE